MGDFFVSRADSIRYRCAWNAPVFCYAFLRDVRGVGAYPKPNLPKNEVPDGTARLPLGTFEGLELICWDKKLDVEDAAAVQNSFALGRFSVPKECRIESGTESLAEIYAARRPVANGCVSVHLITSNHMMTACGYRAVRQAGPLRVMSDKTQSDDIRSVFGCLAPMLMAGGPLLRPRPSAYQSAPAHASKIGPSTGELPDPAALPAGSPKAFPPNVRIHGTANHTSAAT